MALNQAFAIKCFCSDTDGKMAFTRLGTGMAYVLCAVINDFECFRLKDFCKFCFDCFDSWVVHAFSFR